MHRYEVTVGYEFAGRGDLEWLKERLYRHVLVQLTDSVEEFEVLDGEVTSSMSGKLVNAGVGTIVLAFGYYSFEDKEYGLQAELESSLAEAEGREYDPDLVGYMATETWIIKECLEAGLDSVRDDAGWADTELVLEVRSESDTPMVE